MESRGTWSYPEAEMEHLHRLIPGGAHTYSRGDDQFPPNAPVLLSHGQGAYVWDTDGRQFLDYGMGLRSVSLGYAEPRVVRSVNEAASLGNCLTRTSSLELLAAERMVQIFDAMDMVKFAKNGSTVTSAAVKLARAATGRSRVLICRQHPFHSFDDWFIASTVMNRGIPEGVSNLVEKFDYGNVNQVCSILQTKEFACIVMEPCTTELPCQQTSCVSFPPASCTSCPEHDQNFLKAVRKACDASGTLMILDEVITAFRWHMKGAQELFKVTPDLMTVGKAIGNGHAISALGGRRDLMNLGGTAMAGQERLFLLSSTHGPEMVGCQAFLTVAEIYEAEDVCSQLWEFGKDFRVIWRDAAREEGVSDFVKLDGPDISLAMQFLDLEGSESAHLRTIFAYEMAERGILIPWIAPSVAHDQDDLEMTSEALRSSFRVVAEVLAGRKHEGVSEHLLKPVFRRFN